MVDCAIGSLLFALFVLQAPPTPKPSAPVPAPQKIHTPPLFFVRWVTASHVIRIICNFGFLRGPHKVRVRGGSNSILFLFKPQNQRAQISMGRNERIPFSSKCTLVFRHSQVPVLLHLPFVISGQAIYILMYECMKCP